MEVETKTFSQVMEPKGSVEVSKNSRGYNWTIKSYNEDINEALKEVEKIDMDCRKKYGKEVNKDE